MRVSDLVPFKNRIFKYSSFNKNTLCLLLVCSMPLEYCEYSGMTDKCLSWLEANLPSEFEKLNLAGLKEVADAEKKHQKRGGKVDISSGAGV